MVNWRWVSRASWAGLGGAMGREGLHGRRLPAPFGNLLPPTSERA